QLRQRVGRIDAQEGVRPGRPNAVVADHLDASANAQAIGDTLVASGGHVEVSVERQAKPPIVAQGGARHFLGALSGLLVVARRKIRASRALRQMVPVVPPGAFYGTIALRALGTGRGQQVPREQASPERL